MCSSKQKEVKRIKRMKRTYDINLIFYSTTVKIFTISIKQSKKISILNEIVSKNFRIEIRIF